MTEQQSQNRSWIWIYIIYPVALFAILLWCIWDWLFPGPMEEDFVGLWQIVVECQNGGMPHHSGLHQGPDYSHGAEEGWYAIYPKPDGTYGMMVSREYADWIGLPTLAEWNEIALDYEPNSGLRADRPHGPFNCLEDASDEADRMHGMVDLHVDDSNVAVPHLIQIWMWEDSDLHGYRRAPRIQIDHSGEVGTRRHRGVIH